MESLEELIKYREAIFVENKWHKNDFYFDKESFLKIVQENEYKVGRATKTVKELKQFLNVGTSETRFSDCDENLIVIGRANDRIDRDYLFFVNAENALKNLEIENSFFINYTGHCGSVGAALSKIGVPIVWHLFLDVEAIAEKRVIEQIQDYYYILEENNKTANSFGLMLESPHGRYETFDVGKFPAVEVLKENNIKSVYVFIEESADVMIKEDYEDFYNDRFKEYIDSLKKEFSVKFIPIDEKSGQESLVAEKEKIKNPEIYYSNFECKRVK